MASTAQNFNLTRNQIITRAFNILNAFEANETPSAEDFSFAQDMLNMMVKDWTAQGIHLFQRRTGFIFTQYNQNKYNLEDPSHDHATDTYYQTSISATEAAGQTVLSVTSTTNMTVADQIGIVLDDGTLQWSTISSKTSTTVTIADALTDSATAGNLVYNYTTSLDKPSRIHYAFRRDSLSSTDIPMFMLANSDYWKLPVKENLGIPTQFYYDVQINNVDFYVWPTPSVVTDIIGFSYDKRINDFDSATDYPDFPSEWLRAIVFNLAADMSYAYGKYLESSSLEAKARMLLENIKAFDQEEANITLVASNKRMSY